MSKIQSGVVAMRFTKWSLMSLLLLTACSGYAPPANINGLTRDQLVAQMGQPDTVRQITTGTRLEFPRGPMGHHTWFVDVDTDDKIIKTEQVLTEPNFNQITPGMTQQEVRQRLGRPSETQGLGRARGVVWNYRYENNFCQWFQVEISQEQQVRSASYGQPPECMGHDDIIIP
jgi:outer membrane protein assembly factor BamE (lipoprotein component of BamABCDE complex)